MVQVETETENTSLTQVYISTKVYISIFNFVEINACMFKERIQVCCMW